MTAHEDKNIKKMLAGDIDDVCKIWLINSSIAHGFIPAGFWCSLLPDIKKEWENNLSKNNCEMYVYKDEDGVIKGFIIARKSDNYVEELFVSPQYQGKGIGSKLLKEIKEGKDFLEVTVYQLNTGAIIFYKKEGFEIKNGEDSVYIEDKTGQWKLRMRWDRK
jgi:putative acetyltransferase